MDVNLRQIQAFLAVVSAGGFTRAAQLLSLSQPALTVRVQQLEEQVGFRLINRGTRTLELTREGIEVFPVFQRMIRDFDAAMADLRDLATAERRVVRIAALPSFCTGPLAALIMDFKSADTGLSFILRDAVGQKITGLVRTEDVDFGIGVAGVPEPDLDYLDLCQDRLMLVAPLGHPLVGRQGVTLADVANYPFIQMDRQTSVRDLVDAAFVRAGVTPRTACEATYMATAVTMVRAGLGVTLLPSSAVELKIYPDIAARAVDAEGMSRRIVIIKRRNGPLKPTAQALIGALLTVPLPDDFRAPQDLGYIALPRQSA